MRTVSLLALTHGAPIAFADLEASLEEKRRLVESGLRRLWHAGESAVVAAAVEDSLLAPAKRLRPILALLVAEMFRADLDGLLPAACAVEMVHTASLILDDLPCMDDAAMRRGRPACHAAHGEATAILAAFALQNRAFEVLAQGWPGGPDAGVRAVLAGDLARAVGMTGMIAGQAMDLALNDANVDFGALEFVHSRKTGALFICSASVGAAQAGAAEKAAVATYAKNLGLAFQVVDDLLDVSGAADVLGKSAGKDAKKSTFVSFAGREGAATLAQELAATARAAIETLGPRAQPLRELSYYVVSRRR
jgi:geranylgeranyl pyrophosphate synthase